MAVVVAAAMTAALVAATAVGVASGLLMLWCLMLLHRMRLSKRGRTIRGWMVCGSRLMHDLVLCARALLRGHLREVRRPIGR